VFKFSASQVEFMVMRSNFSSGAYSHIPALVRRSILAIGFLFAMSAAVYPQESVAARHLQDPTTRKSSVERSGRETTNIDSASCAAKSDDVASTVSKAGPCAPESQERKDAKSAVGTSTGPLTVAAPSKDEWLRDQIQRDDPAESVQAPRSEEPVNAGVGSDRQCKPQEGSLKIKPVTPN
jgi:hypothetical protein